MKVTTKNGVTKNYKLTLKMMQEMGYQMRLPARWHYVSYNAIISALETLYPELKNNIESAML